MINKLTKIILLIVKNVDEGDGASLKMINSSVHILMRDEKYQVLFNKEFDLKSIINDFIKFEYIIINPNNNYELTELGREYIKYS